MRTTHCAVPSCGSYHMGHDNAGSHEVELRRWGWTWKGDPPNRVFLCQRHSEEYDEVPKPEARGVPHSD